MMEEEEEDISLEDDDDKEEKEEGAPNATELQKSTVVQFTRTPDEDDDDSKKEEEKRRRRKNEQQQQQQQEVTTTTTTTLGSNNNNNDDKKILYRDVRADTRCSICWGTVKNCVTVRVCLHRFCNDCVQESIRKNQMCCPECRAKVASRRDFVKDPKFDAIVSAIYASKGGAESYDEKEERFSRKEATTILEDNLEKQREERNRY